MILLNNEEIKFTTFPNGETKMDEQSIEDARAHYNTISFKYHTDADLIRLMFVKKYMDEAYTSKVHLVIYYMPYSRMDRIEGASAFTLKYVSQFINNLNFESVIVVEPHSDVTPALLDKCASVFVNDELITIAMNETNFDLEYDYLVYPDAGAQKRYAKFFDGNVLVGHKERDFQTGRINKLDVIGTYNGTGKKAIIVDDLSSYGGTFILTAEKLKEIGFEEIYLLVAHAEDSIFKGKIFEEGSLIKKVFTTDSILSEPLVWTNKQYQDRISISKIEELT